MLTKRGIDSSSKCERGGNSLHVLLLWQIECEQLAVMVCELDGDSAQFLSKVNSDHMVLTA